MVEVRPGDRVEHPELGAGTLLALRAGRRARVAFDGAPELPRTVERSVLARAGDGRGARAKASTAGRGKASKRGPPASRTTGPRGRRTSAGAGGAPRREVALGPGEAAEAGNGAASRAHPADLRQTIEALRLGVVPARFVGEYTIAREREIAAVEELLAEGRGFRAVWGDYGAGKTHLLDVIEGLARERGFATARVEIDPHEFTASHPKRLYRAVLEALSLPGEVGLGAEPLFQRLIESSDHFEPGGKAYSRFLSPYLHSLRSGDEDAIGWLRDYVYAYDMDAALVTKELRRIGWRGPPVLALSDYRTYGRMYVHLIGTLASWARDAGAAGLLLLFDEVEFVEKLRREELEWAMQALKHIAAVTLSRKRLAFDPEGLYRGGQPVHRAIPLRFRADQPLLAVFALTPLERISELFDDIVADRSQDIRLAALTGASTPALVRKVAALYGRAYPGFRPKAADLRRVASAVQAAVDEGHDSPRAIVRGSVLLLDGLRRPLSRGIATS